MIWSEEDVTITLSEAVSSRTRQHLRTEYAAFLPTPEQPESAVVWDAQRASEVCKDSAELRKNSFPTGAILDNGLHQLEAEAISKLAEAIAYLPPNEQSLVWSSVAFALKAHAKQVRQSGEPFSTHILAVVNGLAKQKLDAATLAAGALHDTVEDCATIMQRPAFTELLDQIFGGEVLEPVLYITKIQDIRSMHAVNGHQVAWIQELYHHLGMIRPQDKTPAEQVDELYRLQLIISLMIPSVASPEHEKAALRAAMIKLQDRLHNMQTLDAMSPKSQLKNANETKEIYVRIARKLGLFDIANALADLSEHYLEPAKQTQLKERQDLAAKLTKDVAGLPLEQVKNFVVPPALNELQVEAEFIVPGAAAMQAAGQPFVTLELKVPDLESETGLSQENALNRVTKTITKHLSKEYGSKKKFLFPNMSTVMELIKSEVLTAFSFYIPAPPELQETVKLLRVNISSETVFSRENQSILPLLQPEASSLEQAAALEKWHSIQQHATGYKAKFNKLFSNFTSAEVLLALTQRIPAGMMLIIGAPPTTGGPTELPKVPWLVSQAMTIKDYIQSIGSLKKKKITSVIINGMVAQDLSLQLLPFDEITIVATKAG